MVTYSQISNFTYVNQLLKMSKVWKWRNIYERFTSYNLFCNKSYMCMQCNLYVTAIYFKRLSTENDYDTDCTGF